MVSVPQNRARQWSWVNKILHAFGVEGGGTAATRHSLCLVLTAGLALWEFKLVLWLGREVSIGLSSFLRREATEQRKKIGFQWLMKRFSQS